MPAEAIAFLASDRASSIHGAELVVDGGTAPTEDDRYPGLHPAIIDRELFDQVQASLGKARDARATNVPAAGTSMLKGLLFDAEGAPMSPTSARGQGGRLHRYYVSSPLLRGKPGTPGGSLRRIAARPLEALILDWLHRLSAEMQVCEAAVSRVVLRSHAVDVHLHKLAGADWPAFARSLEPDDKLENDGDGGLVLTVEIRSIRRGGRTWLVTPHGQTATTSRRPDRALIKALHLGHQRLREAETSPLTPLANLAQPRGIGAEVPLLWAEQRRMLGFPAAPGIH